MKVNCDASLVEESMVMGLGCCVRNSDGSLLFSLSKFYVGASFIPLAELCAIAEGMVMSIASGAVNIVVEIDCKGSIDFHYSEEPCLNEFGLVLVILISWPNIWKWT
ncbi:hypothetical protein LguiA_030581 [Lonicera macranthoides]